MDSLKDVEDNTLIPTSSYRFEYLLATCKVRQLTLLPEEDDDDGDDSDHCHHLRDRITNVVDDEHPSTSKNDDEKEGICLKKLRRLGKVPTKPRSAAVSESDGSSSSDGGETEELELSPSPNWKRKRPRNVGGGGISIQEPPPPGLPEKIKNLLLHLPETREVLSAKLVIQKKLTNSDIWGNQNRLSIPAKKLQEPFLTEEEEVHLRTRNGKNVGSMEVPFITPAIEITTVNLRRWEMKKQSGPPSISYVLARNWNEIRARNRLRSGMNVQLWAIRIDGILCFALDTI